MITFLKLTGTVKFNFFRTANLISKMEFSLKFALDGIIEGCKLENLIHDNFFKLRLFRTLDENVVAISGNLSGSVLQD